jgi:hypothetical protein
MKKNVSRSAIAPPIMSDAVYLLEHSQSDRSESVACAPSTSAQRSTKVRSTGTRPIARHGIGSDLPGKATAMDGMVSHSRLCPLASYRLPVGM